MIRSRKSCPLRLFAIAIAAGALGFATSARAQQQGAGPSDQGGGQGGGSASASSTSTSVTPVYTGIVAPPPNGGPLGGGNATESSARAVTGDQEDHFDMGQGASGGSTMYGNANGTIDFGRGGARTREIGGVQTASVHVVKKGDTLWAICDEYFQNAYQWPRIWSYNPQIQNPHWIYPNETVRLKPGVPLGPALGGPANAPDVSTPTEGEGVQRSAMRTVPPDTVFLRDEGFVNDDANLNWGAIVGAPEDKMFLSDTDQLYIRVGNDHDVKLGQELTVFRPIRKVGDGNGQVISIQGTVRVDDWNPNTRIARAQIVETLDAIERGARVGPIPRRFEVISPRRNESDVTAHVAIAVHPHVFFGQNQVVFIDRGSEAGLKPGNRLFIINRGDHWRQTMISDQGSRRIAGEREEPGVVETTPKLRDESALPEEVTGELRVLDVQKSSSTCLVTKSKYEIEPGDLAVSRKGY